jgi:D-glycero-D-manno-heptose 1,7-bisphosphate phosphatase
VTVARAVFLDKDGTLVDNVPYNADPNRVRLARGASTLARLVDRGYLLYVVSNQPGLARGLLSHADLARTWRRLCDLLAAKHVRVDDFIYCPHAPGEGCPCRKPADGLLRRAAAERGISLSESWMVGDILDDIEAGRRAGCRTVLIDNGNETEWRRAPLREPHLRVRDLREATAGILRMDWQRRLPSQGSRDAREAAA